MSLKARQVRNPIPGQCADDMDTRYLMISLDSHRSLTRSVLVL